MSWGGSPVPKRTAMVREPYIPKYGRRGVVWLPTILNRLLFYGLVCGNGLAIFKEARKILLIVIGSICVMLGVIGIFLPLVPTTCFLLLAAICYGRSSTRFYNWLMTNRWFGEYTLNYREGRGISRKQKLVTILFLWLTIGSSAWFVVTLWRLRLLLLGIAVGVTIHLVMIKTRPAKSCSSSFEVRLRRG